MKKLITLALAALVLSPLINASDKEREINEKPVKPAVIQPVIDNQQLFLDNLHKCGLIKRMVKKDLEQLINDKVTGDTFAQERRLLVQKAAAETWLQYTETADGKRINPKKLEDMFNTFKMLLIEPLENVTQKLEKVDSETLTHLLPFCRYMLLKEQLLEKIEEAIALKEGKLLAQGTNLFDTKTDEQQQQLFLDNLYKCGLVKRMVKDDLKDLDPKDPRFENERRYLCSKAILTACNCYKEINNNTIDKLISTFEMLITTSQKNVAKKLKSINLKTLIDLLPFCHYMLLKEQLLKKIEKAIALKAGERLAQDTNFFDTKAGKRLIKVLKWHGFEEKKRMLPEAIPTTLKHNSQVRRVVISDNGLLVGTVLENRTARIWDATTGKCLHILTHNDNVMRIVFDPKSKRAATASDDKTVKLWDVTTGICLKIFSHATLVNDVTFSPDGETIATGARIGNLNDSAKLWDVTTGKCLQTYHTSYSANSITFNRNGKILATASGDAIARLWDAHTGACLKTFTHTEELHHAALSSDGEKLLTTPWGKHAKLWDVTTETCLQTFSHLYGYIKCACLSPDEKTIATASSDNTGKLWDVTTGKCLQAFPHTGDVNWIVFNPKRGKTLLTASNDKTAKLWNTKGKCLQTFTHTDKVKHAAFSSDGSIVATASDDKTAKLWYLRLHLSLADYVTIEILDNLKKAGKSVDVTQNYTLNKLITKLPIRIKKYYIKQGTIKGADLRSL